MTTKIKNQFMFGVLALMLGTGMFISSVSEVQAEVDSSVSGKQAVAKKMIKISPAKGSKAERMLVAQASGEAKAGTLSKIIDLQTAEEDNEVSIKIRSSQALEYTAFKLVDPLRLVLDFPNMEKSDLSGVMEVNQGVVNTIRPLYFEEAKVMRLEIGLTKAVSYEILRPSSYVMDIRLKDNAPPAVEAKAPEEEPETASQQVAKADIPPTNKQDASPKEEISEEDAKDTCYKILGGVRDSLSMEFQNANIKNIFRVIAEVSEFSLVLSPDISGVVSIRLIDVPWNKAFELILENNGLGRVCEGNIIRIVPNATLLAAQVAEPLITEMIRINYADIAEMVTNLGGLKSPRGSITADARTNTLILADIPEKVDEMISVIKTLDVKTPQVMIESKIVEVSRNFAQELGVRWGALTERVSGDPESFPSLVRTGGDLGTRLQTGVAPGFVNPGHIVDLGVSGPPTGQFGVLLATLGLDHVLDIQLEALESQGKARTIATPKVTTLDNKEAKILSGTRLPYQTSSNTQGSVIQFVDANLELKVTPHITADENIYMKILATQNSADFSNAIFGVPSINTKEAFTEVLVKNGATTVLGGIHQKTTSEARRSVPFFANIPFIGYLFRNRAEKDDILELLIFVTPNIIESTTSFSNR